MAQTDDLRGRFDSQLGTLRRVIGRGIQGQSLVDITEGTDIYRQVLSSCLKRFSVLSEGDPLNYHFLYRLSGIDGSQLRWIQDDYRGFVAQALMTRSPEVMRALADAVFDAQVACIRVGDPSALQLFEQLSEYLWRETVRDVDDPQDATSVAHYVVRLQKSLVSITNGLYVSGTLHKVAFIRCLGVEIALFNDLAKIAVDLELDDQLRSVLDGAFESFETVVTYVTEIRRATPDSPEIYETIRVWLAGLPVGLHGWLLSRGRVGKSGTSNERLIDVVEDFGDRINPWDATPLILQSGFDGILGWTRWQMLGATSRSGFLLDISAYVRRAMVLEATAQGEFASYEQLVRMIGSSETLVSFSTELLADIAFLESMTAIRPRSEALASQRVAIATVERLAQAQFARERANAPLSDERIARFKETVSRIRAAGRPFDVFHSIEVARPETSVQVDEIDQFIRFGFPILVPREYFSDTSVHAEPEDLAAVMMMALNRAEARYLLDFLFRNSEFISADGENIASTLNSILAEYQTERSKARVVLEGPWRSFEDLDPLVQWSEIDGAIRHGSIGDIDVDWFIEVERSCIYVFSSEQSPTFEWISNDDRPEFEIQEMGRLVVNIGEHEPESDTLPGGNPEIPRDAESVDERRVLVDVYEAGRLKISGSKITCLEILDS